MSRRFPQEPATFQKLQLPDQSRLEEILGELADRDGEPARGQLWSAADDCGCLVGEILIACGAVPGPGDTLSWHENYDGREELVETQYNATPEVVAHFGTLRVDLNGWAHLSDRLVGRGGWQSKWPEIVAQARVNWRSQT